jgi:putative nucleotidyltransferase with HDIG domain
MEFAIDRTEVEKSFRDYTAAYNLNEAKVKLKVDHTFRVAALSDVITDSLGMTGYDKDLAWLLGMLHDIGRFEQVRRYHTFRDALSINHAELSADILFRDGLIRNFINVGADCPPSGDYLLIEKVIRLHNVFQLPDDLTERELRFATILRDADKLDIVRVNVETPRSEIYNVQEDIFMESEITDEVYEAILQRQNLFRNMMKTPADLMLGHVSFVFGLVYPVSVRLMKEQGYLETVLQFPSRNARTRQRFAEIRKVVHEYMEERIQRNGRNEYELKKQ